MGYRPLRARACRLIANLFSNYPETEVIDNPVSLRVASSQQINSPAVVDFWICVNQLTAWLMELGGSMPHSQGPSNNPYPEPNQLIPISLTSQALMT